MENPKNKTFLSIKDVSVSFGKLRALDHIDLEVDQGAIFGIAGPNGAGKTTLMNVISGTLKPTEGVVFLEDKMISSFSPMTVCHHGVARTFQIPVLFPTLTVFDNVRVGMVFGHAPGKKSSRTIGEIISLVGLQGKEDHLAANIDLYTRKLLMLAAALSTEPKLLLLDEPLGGLNFREIDEFMKVVREINRGLGVTVLIIEHLFDKLVEISEKIMILDFGMQIYVGPSDRVTEDKRVIEVYLGMKHHA